MTQNPLMLIAFGGNALVQKGQKGTAKEQFINLKLPMRQIARLSKDYKIDKDLASSILAQEIKADIFVIVSDVEGAGINWRRPDQKVLRQTPLDEMEKYVGEGQFPAGSMGPKVEAIMQFFKATGNRGVICHLEDIEKAITGKAGTEIIK